MLRVNVGPAADRHEAQRPLALATVAEAVVIDRAQFPILLRDIPRRPRVAGHVGRAAPVADQAFHRPLPPRIDHVLAWEQTGVNRRPVSAFDPSALPPARPRPPPHPPRPITPLPDRCRIRGRCCASVTVLVDDVSTRRHGHGRARRRARAMGRNHFPTVPCSCYVPVPSPFGVAAMPPALPRPSFGLSRQVPGDDLFAEWQGHVDAGRIGGRQDHRASNAAADAWARVVLGGAARRATPGGRG